MNTTTTLPNVLFIISLSSQKKNELQLPYESLVRPIRSFENVDVFEEVNASSLKIVLSNAEHYNVVVLLCHTIGNCLELSDGTLFPLIELPDLLQPTFSSFFHLAACNGTRQVAKFLKIHNPNAIFYTADDTTQLELILLVYAEILKYHLNKDNCVFYYETEKNHIFEIQNNRPKEELQNLPFATTLGTNDYCTPELTPELFAPILAVREQSFPVLVILHFDPTAAALKIITDYALGCDPDTHHRPLLKRVLNNIRFGDEISLQLSFLDERLELSPQIRVCNRDSSFKQSIVVIRDYQEVRFDIVVLSGYTGDVCWGQLIYQKGMVTLLDEPQRFKVSITDKINRVFPFTSPSSSQPYEEETKKAEEAEEQMVKELTKVIFRGHQRHAVEFLRFCKMNKKARFITREVTRLVDSGILSRNYCRRDLWRILTEGKVISFSESTWAKGVPKLYTKK